MGLVASYRSGPCGSWHFELRRGTVKPMFDEQGWHIGRLEPLPVAEAYSILAPEDDSRIADDRLSHQAARFFAAELALLTPKHYPSEARPRRDRATVEVGRRGGERAMVEIRTLPLEEAPAVVEAAHLGARTMGGFEALVTRGRRLWQCSPPEPHGEPRAALLLAGIFASLSLGPILAPDGSLFGVKGARERLASKGWR